MTRAKNAKSPGLSLFAVAMSAALVLSACSSAQNASTSSSASATSGAPVSSSFPPSSSARPSATASASASGTASGEPAYAAALTPKIDQLIKDLAITSGGVLIRSPELGDWTTTFGTTTWHGSEPVTVDEHIRIGSNTKTWTGTVILQLVDEGKISLDDPVSKYRPDVPNGDNITISQLLSMRSGLANYTTDLDLNQQQDNNPNRAWTPEELLAKGLALPPAFAPGEGWMYSNTNYVLLGMIIEQVTGMPVGQAFKTRLFDPLGLTGTSFPDITDSSIADPHPQFYTFGTNVGTIDSLVLSPEIQAGALDGTLEPFDVTDDNPSWAWAAGSGISTMEDLAVYVKAMVGGGLLSPQLQQERIASVQPTDPAKPTAANYGLALAGLGQMYGHTGELPGTNSVMAYDPAKDITVVTWATGAPAPNGKAPAVEIAQVAIKDLYAN